MTSSNDEAFAEAAAGQGLLTQDQAAAALKIVAQYEVRGRFKTLPEVLVAKKVMSSAQAREVLGAIDLRILKCPNCGTRSYVAGEPEGQVCCQCHGPMGGTDSGLGPDTARKDPSQPAPPAAAPPGHQPTRDEKGYELDAADSPSVVLLSQGAEAARFAVEGKGLTFGRLPDCSVTLDDARVSKRHARIVDARGNWVLQDMHSRNGTYVNETRVTEHALQSGDFIRLGHTLFLYLAPGPVEAEPPAANVAGWLEVASGASAGQKVPVTERPLLIGSDPSAMLRLTEPGMAPFRAHVVAKPDGVRLVDLVQTLPGGKMRKMRANVLAGGKEFNFAGVRFRFAGSAEEAATTPPAGPSPQPSPAAETPADGEGLVATVEPGAVPDTSEAAIPKGRGASDESVIGALYEEAERVDDAYGVSGVYEGVDPTALKKPDPAAGTIHVTCTQGSLAGQQFALGQAPLVVGRAQNAEIRATDPSVADHHARLFVVGGKAFVQDLLGKGDLELNGKRFKKHRRLDFGDTVKIGELEFRVHL